MTNKSITKKSIAILAAAVLIVVCVIAVSQTKTTTQLIRIHIRANSNSEQDQAIKLKVRDAVTEYLTVELDGVTDREEAYSRLQRLENTINDKAIAVLRAGGFGYGSRITISNEYFPTRTYEGIVVDSGYYDAVIIELGDGVGDNWWCVVYPPLCFVESGSMPYFEYKSIIAQMWKKFLKGK